MPEESNVESVVVTGSSLTGSLLVDTDWQAGTITSNTNNANSFACFAIVSLMTVSFLSSFKVGIDILRC